MWYLSTSIQEEQGRIKNMAMSFNIILNLQSLKITKKLLSKGKQLSGGLIGFGCVHYNWFHLTSIGGGEMIEYDKANINE